MANEPSEAQQRAAAQASSAAQSPAAPKPAGAGAPPAPATAPTPPAQQPSDEVRYTPEGWKERARAAFGVSPHAVHGALADRESDEELSREDVQRAIDEFRDRPGVADEEGEGG